MTLNSATAQRWDNFDNQALVDFFPIHLPCQILIIDTVGMERRGIPPTTEFILKCIINGLSVDTDIAGILGIDLEYCRGLLEELRRGEYIGVDAFGTTVLWRKGKELIESGAEAVPLDRRISLIWDPLCKKFLGRVSMYTRKGAGNDGIHVPLPGAFAVPELSDISSAAVKESQIGAGERAGKSGYEVLRITAVQKSLGRFRQALALVYRTERGDLTLRIATNGNIDEELTTACAQAAVPKLIGIDKTFSTRQGGAAVKKRYAELTKFLPSGGAKMPC